MLLVNYQFGVEVIIAFARRFPATQGFHVRVAEIPIVGNPDHAPNSPNSVSAENGSAILLHIVPHKLENQVCNHITFFFECKVTGIQ